MAAGPNLTTRGSDVTAEVNNFYSRTLLERAVPEFVHTMFGQVKDIPQKSGTDTIKFRKYGALSANTTALTEGVTPVGKKLSISDITAQVDWYGDFVTITDELEIESIDPVLTEAAEVLGEQAGDSLDQIARDVLVAGTNVVYANGVANRSSVAADIDRADVRDATLVLYNNEAKELKSRVDPSTGFNTQPLGKSFVGIAHADTIHILEDETGWIPVKEYARKDDVMEAEVGTLSNVRFLRTTNAKIFSGAGSGSADVYATLILARNAYGVSRISGKALQNIVKARGSAGAEDPLNQRSTSGWKASFVTKILQQPWLVRVEHTA